MTFNYENIPKEIKKYKRFVLFNRNKAPKTIYNNGAKANDPNTWNSFDECYKAWVSNPDKFMGIGIELGELEEGKVLAGIDLDHIIDDDGNIIDPSFEILIEKIGSYTEISPSGKGIHILFFLNEIMDSVKSNIEHFEFYSQGRYFTMTGNIYKEHKELKQLTTEQLDFILEKTIFMPDLKEGIEESENLNQTLIEKGITIEKVVNYYSEKYPEFKNLRKKGTNKYWTKSPFHSSNTGHNFELDYEKNVWYCWRHNLGGSVFELIAFCEGILSCKDYGLDPEIVRPRMSRDDKIKIWENKKEQFRTTLDVLKEKFNINLIIKSKKKESNEHVNFALTIHPDSWFEEVKKKDGIEIEFNFIHCAKDIVNSNLNLIMTEYTSNILYVWTGKKWLYNAENYLKKLIREYADINTFQLDQVINFIKDKTRITDPDKIGKSLQELMPLPRHVLPIKDGLLDLTNGTMIPHDPKYFYLTYFPRQYIKGGKSKKFREFLDIVFKNDPEKDIKETQIYELIAWILTDGYIPQGMALLYGKTGAGKGIITNNIIGNLIGKENYSALSLNELSDRFKPHELFGKLANITNEIGGFLNSEKFKKITDYSPIEIEFKNKDPFKFQSRAKWIATTNEKPDIPDPEDPKYESYFRRIAVEITFNNTLTDSLTHEEIGQWIQALTDPHELDLIFSEVIDNYYMPFVQRGTFTNYKGIEGNKRKYIEDTRPILAYLKDRQNNGLIFTDLEDFKLFIKERNINVNIDFFVVRNENKTIPITIEDVIEKDIIKWAREKGLSTSKISKRAIGNTLNYLGYEINSIDKRIQGHKFKAWYPLIILPINGINNIFSDINKEKFKENISLKDFENIYDKTDKYDQSLHAENVKNPEGTEKVQYFTGSVNDQSRKLNSFSLYIYNKKNKLIKEKEEKINNIKEIRTSNLGTDINKNQSNTENNQSLDENRNFSHEGIEGSGNSFTTNIKTEEIKFFKTIEYYTKEYFNDMGITLIDSFDSRDEHYYKLKIPNDLNVKVNGVDKGNKTVVERAHGLGGE